MNQSTQQESTPSPNPTPQGSPYHKQHNPYARMSQRRAIACTICAKAKTKCDKAVPSCSRCTAKGLHCEPRSTRRTSDNSYRKPTKHLVSPKRYPSTSSIPTLGTSPRSVPSSGRPQMVRSVSQMDFHTAAKLGQQPAGFNFNNMLSPLPTYAPHIVDECYSYSSSPEQGMHGFPLSMEKNYMASRSVTPGTPDSFASYEPLPMSDTFEPYMNGSVWSDDGSIPIGLGFENDIPNMMHGEMWGTPEPEMPPSMGVCDSPASMHGWSHPQLSASPPQLPIGLPPHKQAVPSLSISECSEDFNSPQQNQEEWASFQPNMMGKPMVTRPYMENVKAYPTAPQPIWEDIIMPRTQPF
ncbi:hypothetical protein CC80DRAFT_495411 [Byssothecium circinans]|uniref:Zn(2)-C6 fungal-type domain-containing protein n=1 Tax=Byssothecium circinans TaxID=147558 RepID=A0A6A5TTU5_9PLEO|nr:hypothetical protein CC80DRAFT_495411 [Byssothecium circinans]